MLNGSTLFYGGIVVMVIAALAGLVGIIVVRISRKRLNQCLEKEYGKEKN